MVSVVFCVYTNDNKIDQFHHDDDIGDFCDAWTSFKKHTKKFPKCDRISLKIVCACQIYHELSGIRRSSMTFKAQWKCYRTINVYIYLEFSCGWKKKKNTSHIQKCFWSKKKHSFLAPRHHSSYSHFDLRGKTALNFHVQ